MAWCVRNLATYPVTERSMMRSSTILPVSVICLSEKHINQFSNKKDIKPNKKVVDKMEEMCYTIIVNK